MENYLINHIGNLLGKNIDFHNFDNQDQIPLVYRELYRFYTLYFEGEDFLVLEVIDQLVNIQNLKKHRQFFKDRFQMEPVFFIRELSYYRRKALSEHRISYIEGNRNYFIGNYRRETTIDRKSLLEKEKFNYLAQNILRYFILDSSFKCNVQDMAKLLHMTEMSASRGLKELYVSGILDYRISGKTQKSKTYSFIPSDPVFQKIFMKVRSPIRKRVYLRERPLQAIISGEMALAHKTNMNSSTRPCYAISLKEFKALDLRYELDSFALEEPMLELECWAYPPKMHEDNTMIDDFSLYCSYLDTKDERIRGELDDLARRHGWLMG